MGIVIPFFNGDGFIARCLDSVLAEQSSGLELRVYVVNNSSENTNIHELAKGYRNVHIVDAPARLGFARACNIGAETALANGAENIVVLNQDTIVWTECIRNLIRVLMDQEGLGITAPVLYSYDFQNIESFFVRWYLTQCPELLRDALEGNLKERYDLERISGACFAIKGWIVKRYGLFDPLFFMYFEDEDLCRRLRYLKMGVAIVPQARVAHAHSHTAASGGPQKLRIDLFRRESMGVYRLKELRRTFIANLLRWITDNTVDYVHCVLHAQTVHLLQYLRVDYRLVLSLREISKTRRRERQLLDQAGNS